MNISHIISALRRLNDLQSQPRAPWVGMLTEGEYLLAIAQARQGLPTSILGHHDRMVQRGKRSLAQVRNGVCGACHLRLPLGHRMRAPGGQDLDVCDHCGVFLEWTTESAPSTSAGPTPAGKRRAAKSARRTTHREATVA